MAKSASLPGMPIQPGNPNNPQDMLGVAHNFVLFYINKNYGKAIGEITDPYEKEAFIKAKTEESIKDLYGGQVNLAFMDQIYGYEGLWSRVDFNNYRPITEHTKISSDEKEAIISCFDEVTKLPFDTIADGNAGIATILRFESLFLKQEGNDRKGDALAAFAIARYSIYYLLSQAGMNPPAGFKFNWGNFLSDVAGGLLGAGGGVLGVLGGASAGTAIYDYVFGD